MDELTVLANPLTVAIIVSVVLVILLNRSGSDAEVHSEFDKSTAQPGQLFADGNDATSKLEMGIRQALEDEGFALYPAATALVTYPDEKGKSHKYTPDIIVRKRKVIVEVDPQFTHEGKEDDDRRRGNCYQDLGYGVVRIRLGPKVGPLGKYDVSFRQTDFNPATMMPLVAKMIRKAKPDPRRHTR